jgi:hypothetical protein
MTHDDKVWTVCNHCLLGFQAKDPSIPFCPDCQNDRKELNEWDRDKWAEL